VKSRGARIGSPSFGWSGARIRATRAGVVQWQDLSFPTRGCGSAHQPYFSRLLGRLFCFQTGPRWLQRCRAEVLRRGGGVEPPPLAALPRLCLRLASGTWCRTGSASAAERRGVEQRLCIALATTVPGSVSSIWTRVRLNTHGHASRYQLSVFI
jgi:hypothetical protein